MSMRSMKRVFRTALFFLAVVWLAGCRTREELPVYQMEIREDGSELLLINGVKYRRDRGENELASYYNGGDVWTLAEGLGRQIGVCGKGAESGGGLVIYEAAGDEGQAVLYTFPRKFYFGGTDVRLWLREDVSLGLPTAEMVASVTVTWNKEGSAPAQIEGLSFVEDLLDAYRGARDQAVKLSAMDGQKVGCTLTLHHKDYPFLQYEISGCYSPAQGVAYCQNDALEWFALPGRWAEVLGNAY